MLESVEVDPWTAPTRIVAEVAVRLRFNPKTLIVNEGLELETRDALPISTLSDWLMESDGPFLDPSLLLLLVLLFSFSEFVEMPFVVLLPVSCSPDVCVTVVLVLPPSAFAMRMEEIPMTIRAMMAVAAKMNLVFFINL